MTALEFKDIYISITKMFGEHLRITAVINGTHITEQGTIVKFEGNSVVMRTDSGQIRFLGVSSIFSVEPVLAPEGAGIPEQMDRESDRSNQRPENPQTNEATSFPAPVRPSYFPRKLAPLAKHTAYTFDLNREIKALKGELKSGGSRIFRQEVTGIVDSLQNAYKNRSVLDKYPTLNQKLFKLWAEEKCESTEDYRGIYTLWGLLAMAAGKYPVAFEPFVRAQKYILAATAAIKAGEQENCDIFYVCALLQREPAAQIDQELADLCSRRQEASFLHLLLEKYKNDAAACEQLVSCAYAICLKSGNVPNLITDHTCQQALELCLEKLPPLWREKMDIQDRWREYSGYDYPQKKQIAQEGGMIRKTGRITMFNKEKKWGRIDKKYFFYIAQVCDQTENDVLLRQLLLSDQGEGLEVCFYLGEDRLRRPGDCAATDIMVSDRGMLEATQRRKVPQIKTEICSGTIIEYNSKQENGIILNRDDRIRFTLPFVRDPYLKSYLINSFDVVDQDVTYTLGWQESKKRFAMDICWVSPREDLMETFAVYVGDEDRRAWNDYLAQRAAETKLDGLTLVSEAQALQNRFIPLDPWMEPKEKPIPPFTWPDSAKQACATARTCVSSPVPTAIPNRAIPSAVTNDPKAERERREGHRCMVEEKLPEAERHLLEALNLRFQPAEALIGDLVTIYLRMPEKLSEAEKLLQRYEAEISKSKLLNLRISIYDKMKKGEELCALYEEALRNDNTAAQKSHHLYCMIGTYIRIKKYPQALQTCLRWEQLLNQNRYTVGWEKLKNLSPNINRQKAIALYHIGGPSNLAEAQKIATDLVRINPADVAANAILNGTLVEVDTFITVEDDYLSETDSAGDADLDFQIPDFIRHQIESMEIGNFLKSQVKSGRYQGDIEQAKKDIKNLLEGTRSFAPKQRSDRLLVACKILEQVDNMRRTNYSQYCGRAMASWGDYMVDQSTQLDTPRMAYLYSIRLLLPSLDDGRGAEQNCVDSYNRYLKSYFIGQARLNDYIGVQNKSSAKEPFNADIFATESIQNVLFVEFFAGILHLLNNLNDPNSQGNGRSRWFDQLINDLYGKNMELRQSICCQLQALLGDHVDNPSKGQFSDALHKARIYMNKQLENLVGEVKAAAKGILKSALPLQPLDEKCKAILFVTDWKRLQSLWSILQETEGYRHIKDFDGRAECLRNAISRVNGLLQDIEREPTEISYDKFRLILEEMLDHLTEENHILYEKFVPELSWKDREQHHRSPDGSVMIYLLLSNCAGYQTADIRSIEMEGADIVYARVSEDSFFLRGGDEKEIIVTLRVKGDVDKTGSIPASLHCKYTFSTTNNADKEEIKSQEFTFVIRNEKFVPLENPFSHHIGSPMTSKDMFYGRDTEIKQLVEKLCPNGSSMNYGQGIAIYGQTRCGKSSLLFHLKDQLSQRYQDKLLLWDIGNIGEILPKEDTAEIDSFLSEFLYTMLDVGDEAIRRHPLLAPIVAEQGLSVPLEGMEARPQDSLRLFKHYMRQLNTIIRQNECMIVIFIDEFTYLHELIKEGKLSENFMKFWKAFLQNNCVYAVVAGQDDMPEFMQEYQNEFAAMDKLKLTYLDENPAKELFRCSLEKANNKKEIIWPDGCEDRIYELTAGSAYLTLIFCSELVNFLNEKGASVVTQGILESFLKERVFPPTKTFLQPLDFEPQLKERGHAEYDEINKKLLSEIARLSKTAGISAIQDVNLINDAGISMKLEQVREMAERLAERDVLIRKGKDHYSIQVGLLQQWLLFEMRE